MIKASIVQGDVERCWESLARSFDKLRLMQI